MRLNRKGSILITSLWILTILSILAMGIGFRISMEGRLSKYNIEKLRGLYIAKAGIVKAREILSKDTNGYDSIRECGVSLPPDKTPENIFGESMGGGSFQIEHSEGSGTHFGMIDENRKININKAEYKILNQLLLGKEPDNLASSIINWRGSAQMIEGAQDRDYDSLPMPYECKHAEFSCIEELMLIKGMTPETFESIKDYVTVYGDGKININTASERVLLALELSASAIGAIIDARNGEDNIDGTPDDVPFSSISQAQSLLTEENDIAILANNNLFTTMSDYFRIEVKGSLDRSKIVSRIACVAKRGEKQLQFYREY